MKFYLKLAAIWIMLFCSTSHALPIVGSPYVGGELGFIKNPKNSGSSLNSRLDIFAGRLYVGYRCLGFLAFEMGYAELQNSRSGSDGTWGPDYFKLRGYDFNTKFILPLLCGLNLNAQVGAACLKQDAENILLSGDTTPIYVSHETKVLPELGVGVQYNFGSHVAIRVSWMHIFGLGGVRRVDFVPVGVTFS